MNEKKTKLFHELAKMLKELIEEVEFHASNTCISRGCIEKALDALEEYEEMTKE
jgi:hypothetical protein